MLVQAEPKLSRSLSPDTVLIIRTTALHTFLSPALSWNSTYLIFLIKRIFWEQSSRLCQQKGRWTPLGFILFLSQQSRLEGPLVLREPYRSSLFHPTRSTTPAWGLQGQHRDTHRLWTPMKSLTSLGADKTAWSLPEPPPHTADERDCKRELMRK